MRILVVGSRDERARLAAELDRTTLTIVGEFATLADARASGIEADATLIGAGRVLRAGSQHFEDGGPENEPLTPRELQVLELMAEGLTNKTIAARLDISDQTVKFHVSSIGAKLGATNRTDAVRRAVRRGLVAL